MTATAWAARSSLAFVLFASAAKGDAGPRLAIEAPAEMGLAEQARIAVRLSAPALKDLQGRITLVSDGANRSTLFSTGGRVAEFRIAANQTEATFGGGGLMLQSGGASGEITLQVSLDSEGEATKATIRVPAVAPVISTGGIRIRSVNGQPITLETREFEVLIPGIAAGRDVARAEFRFQAARPGGLEPTEIAVDVSAQFRSFFEANSTRTDFALVVPFTVTGSLLDIAGAAVTLVNAAGERSNEASATSEIVP